MRPSVRTPLLGVRKIAAHKVTPALAPRRPNGIVSSNISCQPARDYADSQASNVPLALFAVVTAFFITSSFRRASRGGSPSHSLPTYPR